MIRYVVKRILMLIPVLIGVIFIVFSINFISPSDPVTSIVGEDATLEQREEIRESLGLNDPFLVQFGRYLVGVVTRFDLGNDYITGRPVRDEVLERLPTTLTLSLVSLAVASVLGIFLGIISATKQYSIFDYMSTLFALIASSMPVFWIGLMLMLAFSLNLNWFPSTVEVGFTSLRSWVLPVITIALNALAVITRNTRSSMLEVIRQDYITTARSKGLKETHVITRHALKNALIPVITVIGVQIGRTIGNSVVTETIFTIPGIGTLMVNAVKQSNFEVVQGCVLIIAICFSVVNLLVDILYAFIDPRIKGQYVKRSKRPASESSRSASEVLASDGKKGEHENG